MSTDKFGRFRNTVQVKSAVERIYRKQPLPLTADGDFDIGGKRVRFIADPIEDDDCVNKRFMMKTIKSSDDKWKEHFTKQNETLQVKLNNLQKGITSNTNNVVIYKNTLTNNINQLNKDLRTTIKSVDDKYSAQLTEQKKTLNNLQEGIKGNSDDLKILQTKLNTLETKTNTDTKIKQNTVNIERKINQLKVDLSREIKNSANSLTKSIALNKQLAVDQSKKDIRTEYAAYCDNAVKKLEDNLKIQLKQLTQILKSIGEKIEKIRESSALDVDHVFE